MTEQPSTGLSWLGVIIEPFIDPLSRTHWLGLLIFCFVGCLYLYRHLPPKGVKRWFIEIVRHPSVGLDLQLLLGRQTLRFLITGPTLFSAWWVSTRLVRALDAYTGPPEFSELSPVFIAILYSGTLFIVWDLSRYVVHFCMHRFSFLWAFHQVHHSAEVLTPLTFHRIHPVESLFYSIRSVLTTGFVAGIFYWIFRGQLSQMTIFGVPAIGFSLNILFGNFRHSHVWISFPAWLERWIMSPAQHQLHHSSDRRHHGRNYGTWLSIWDRLFKTLMTAEERPEHYGIPAEERNHEFTLVSAWLSPFRALLPLFIFGVCFVMGAQPANAEEGNSPSDSEPTDDSSESSDSTDKEPPSSDGSIIIYASDARILEAGAAYQITEEQLSAFEYDDIERALGRVPGISTRGEDGFGLRPNIGIRGANSDRSAKVTLMEDGVLLAPAPYAAPAAYYFPMTTRFVGIEVFKGAASTRYGPQTVGGAINVQTRQVPNAFRAAADLSYGLRNSAKAHFWVGNKKGKSGFVIEGVDLRSDGFKELDGGGPTGFHRSEGMLKNEFIFSTRNRIQLKLGYAKEESNETYLGLTASDSEKTPYRRYSASQKGLMSWQRTQAELAWVSSVGEKLNFKTVAYHHWLSRGWNKVNAFQSGPDLHDLLVSDPQSGQGAVYLGILKGEQSSETLEQQLRIGNNDRRYHSYGVQSTLIWEQNLNESSLELGVRFHGDEVHRLHTESLFEMNEGELIRTDTATEITLDSDAFAHALSVYLHQDLQLSPRFHLYPSTRVETIDSALNTGDGFDPSVTRTTVLPGGGALLNLDNTDAFVGGYRGFSPVAPGQPEAISPEFSWNYEAGLRHREQYRYAEAIGFFNDYKNITGQCTLSSGCASEDINQQYNGGRVWIYGAETTAGVVLLLPWDLEMPLDSTYTFTRSRFLSDFESDFVQFASVSIADSLPYVAEHQASAHIGLNHERAGVQAGGSYRSAMLDSAGRFDDDVLQVPALLVIDMAAHYDFLPEWKAYLTLQNISRQQNIVSWRPYGARPTAPFQLMVGLKWLPEV